MVDCGSSARAVPAGILATVKPREFSTLKEPVRATTSTLAMPANRSGPVGRHGESGSGRSDGFLQGAEFPGLDGRQYSCGDRPRARATVDHGPVTIDRKADESRRPLSAEG